MKLLTTLLVLLSLPAMAADKFVREGAAGANDGSNWTDAWTSLTTAEASLSRGDTLWVADGSYTGNVTFNVATSGTTAITVKKATAAAHGTETGWSSAYGDGQAVIGSWLSFTTDYWVVDGACSWPTGVGFKVNCTSATGKGSLRSSGTQNLFSGIHLYGTYSGEGSTHTFEVVGTGTHTISNCWFQGAVWEDHIRTGMTAGELNVIRCRFDHTGHPSDSTHRDLMNADYYDGSVGGFDLNFINCIVGGEYADCFLFQNSIPMGNILIENCVFWECQDTVKFGSGNAGMDTGKTVRLQNNVYYSSHSLVGVSAGATNLVYIGSGPFGDFRGPSNPRYSAWVTGAVGYTAGIGNLNNVTPNFINMSSPDGADGIPFMADDGFNITVNSPLVDAGGTGRTADILGNVVPLGSGPDIGAYEYPGEDALAPELTLATIDSTGTNLTLNFTETMSWGADGSNGWTLGLTLGQAVVSYLSGSNTSTLVYTLDRTINGSETVTNGLDFTQAGDGLKDASTNYLASSVSNAVVNSSVQGQADAPAFSLAAGIYYGGQNVTISSGTAGASIYYTTDGSTPDAGDSLHTGQLTFGGPLTLKAIAIAGGYDDSAVTSAFYEINTWQVATSWKTFTLPSKDGVFPFAFTVYPTNTGLDLVLGFSPDPVADYTDLAVIVRFYTDNTIDARNGGSYAAENVIAYAVDTAYVIVGTINVTAKTYSATVNGTVLATDYDFRTEQAAADHLDNFGMYPGQLGGTVSNLNWGVTSSMRVGNLFIRP